MVLGWRRAASSRRAAEGCWIWAVTPRDRLDADDTMAGMDVASPRAAAMSEVKRVLCAIDQGDPAAADQLLRLVYSARSRRARPVHTPRSPHQTWQAH